RDVGVGNEIDVVLRAGTDFEIGMQMHQLPIYRYSTFAIVDRVARIGVDKCSPCDAFLHGRIHGFSSDDDRQKNIRIYKDAAGKSAQRAEQTADEKYQKKFR